MFLESAISKLEEVPQMELKTDGMHSLGIFEAPKPIGVQGWKNGRKEGWIIVVSLGARDMSHLNKGSTLLEMAEGGGFHFEG